MKKVLYIEDTADNRDLVTQILENVYDVHTAVNGEEGIALARAVQPDLILMDKSLPEIDGWEATRRIRTAGAARHVPIIALTAHALPAERVQAIEAGCDDFETKPIAFDRLLDKIAVLLDRYPR